MEEEGYILKWMRWESFGMDSGQSQVKHLWNQMVVGILAPFFLSF